MVLSLVTAIVHAFVFVFDLNGVSVLLRVLFPRCFLLSRFVLVFVSGLVFNGVSVFVVALDFVLDVSTVFALAKDARVKEGTIVSLTATKTILRFDAFHVGQWLLQDIETMEGMQLLKQRKQREDCAIHVTHTHSEQTRLQMTSLKYQSYADDSRLT